MIQIYIDDFYACFKQEYFSLWSRNDTPMYMHALDWLDKQDIEHEQFTAKAVNTLSYDVLHEIITMLK